MGNTANGKFDWGRLLILAGILCMIAAGLWYGVLMHREDKAGQQAAELLEAIVRVREETRGQGQYDKVETIVVQGQTADKERSLADVFATVEIASLGLKVPVLDQWSMEDLSIAPCRYSGSVDQNDLVLLGHNYEGHFGALKNVQIGAPVQMDLMDGTQVRYVVKEVFVIEPAEREKVEQSGYPLTIFTCTPGGQARLVIYCDRSTE